MSISLPYVQAHSNITTVLNKIQAASTPSRFTQDYLATKLGVSSSAARPVIPFLKKTGFLGSDGVPTELYKRFRNPNERGAAAADALRTGYMPLFEVNEYANDLNDQDLKGLVVQVTDLEPDSRNVQAISASFKALREFADFDSEAEQQDAITTRDDPQFNGQASHERQPSLASQNIGLSYTINLNLPATSDIAVFDAIFKSLKDNLL